MNYDPRSTSMEAADKPTAGGDVTFVTLSESVAVFADQAAIAAVMAEPGARRLWCAWILVPGRNSVHRVYVVEAEPGGSLAGLGPRIAGELTVFDTIARVEVVEPSAPPSPYTQGVLRHGHLLWTRDRRPQLEIVWVLRTS